MHYLKGPVCLVEEGDEFQRLAVSVKEAQHLIFEFKNATELQELHGLRLPERLVCIALCELPPGQLTELHVDIGIVLVCNHQTRQQRRQW